MDAVDIKRRMQSIVREGVVVEVDLGSAPPMARVETGSLVTDWITWTTVAGKGVVWWQSPRIGESVIMVCPDGEVGNAVIIGRKHTAGDMPPSVEADETVMVFGDGAQVKYSEGESLMSIKTPGGVSIKCGGGAVVEAGGEVRVASGSVASIEAEQIIMTAKNISLVGPVTASEGIIAVGDVIGAGVSLANHIHGGVQGGNSKTSKPE